jgi:Glycosyl hydrolase catalytic core
MLTRLAIVDWYGVNATEFQSYLQNFYTVFQRPIWVTEWACQNYVNTSDQCTQSEVSLFLNQTQSFMDTTPWVERYAWYGAMENLGGLNQVDIFSHLLCMVFLTYCFAG